MFFTAHPAPNIMIGPTIASGVIFSIFINDISLEKYLSDINLFADDAVESVEDKTIDDIIKKLQECAGSLDRWCLQNKMVLSIEKTRKPYSFVIDRNLFR